MGTDADWGPKDVVPGKYSHLLDAPCKDQQFPERVDTPGLWDDGMDATDLVRLYELYNIKDACYACTMYRLKKPEQYCLSHMANSSWNATDGPCATSGDNGGPSCMVWPGDPESPHPVLRKEACVSICHNVDLDTNNNKCYCQESDSLYHHNQSEYMEHVPDCTPQFAQKVRAECSVSGGVFRGYVHTGHVVNERGYICSPIGLYSNVADAFVAGCGGTKPVTIAGVINGEGDPEQLESIEYKCPFPDSQWGVEPDGITPCAKEDKCMQSKREFVDCHADDTLFNEGDPAADQNYWLHNCDGEETTNDNGKITCRNCLDYYEKNNDGKCTPKHCDGDVVNFETGETFVRTVCEKCQTGYKKQTSDGFTACVPMGGEDDAY